MPLGIEELLLRHDQGGTDRKTGQHNQNVPELHECAREDAAGHDFPGMRDLPKALPQHNVATSMHQSVPKLLSLHAANNPGSRNA